MKTQHILLAVLVAAIWGFNFVVVKTGLYHLPPFVYGAGRFLIAALPLFFVKKPDVPWTILFGIGFSLGFVKFACMFMGIHLGMSAGLASLVLQSQVFFTVTLSILVFGAKIQWNQILGMLIAFVGITAIAVDMHAQSSFIGFLLILGSAMAWSVSNILYQKAGKVDMFGVTVWSSLVPPLPMLAFSWYFEEVDVPVKLLQSLDWIGVICLLFTSCVSTWIGSTLWGILLKTYDAARVAPFSLLIPIFGLSSSWLFLGEKLSSVTLTASLLVFVGLIINQWRFERRPRLLHQEAVVSNKKDKAA